MKSFKNSTLQSPTGAELALYVLKAKGDAKAVVHINHGMAEHAGRYTRFANVLSDAGYHVIAHDHRGHGKTTAPDAPLGSFGKGESLENVLADIAAVHTHVEKHHPDLPLVYFGHSMGAIIGSNYCMRHSDRLAAAALWNLSVDGGFMLTLYKMLLKVERMFKGSDVPSALAKKLTFDDWNKKFAPNRTEFDWLTRDEAEVDKYVADPHCGYSCNNGLWGDVVSAIERGSRDDELSKIRSDLPIHLLAGGKDPCSDYGKAVQRIEVRMKNLGMKDVTCEIIPDNRHEALNELHRDETTAQFIEWLGERV